MNQPETILLVCTGNTCRSVMAEAMLRKALDETLGDIAKEINVVSAGVAAYSGDPASKHAKAAMEELGLDVSCHEACPVSDKALNDADLVLTMTVAQKDRLLRGYPTIESKVMTLTEFAGLTEELGQDIDDPFGGSLEIYRTSARQIRKAIEVIAERIKDLLESSESGGDNHEDRHRE